MNKNKRYDILQILKENNPNPKTELIYTSHFELLISTILSSKSKDTTVNIVSKKLFSVANTPQKILQIGIEKIKNIIKPIGFFNKKAEYLLESSYLLLNLYRGKVPNKFDLLCKLPGIGSKSANLILNILFNIPTISVDTHTFRVSNRTKFAIGKNIKEVEKKLLFVVPKPFRLHCHQWFVLHGKYTCLSRQPKCKICVIKNQCEYIYKTHK